MGILAWPKPLRWQQLEQTQKQILSINMFLFLCNYLRNRMITHIFVTNWLLKL